MITRPAPLTPKEATKIVAETAGTIKLSPERLKYIFEDMDEK